MEMDDFTSARLDQQVKGYLENINKLGDITGALASHGDPIAGIASAWLKHEATLDWKRGKVIKFDVVFSADTSNAKRFTLTNRRSGNPILEVEQVLNPDDLGSVFDRRNASVRFYNEFAKLGEAQPDSLTILLKFMGPLHRQMADISARVVKFERTTGYFKFIIACVDGGNVYTKVSVATI